jgi:hypothetical protein
MQLKDSVYRSVRECARKVYAKEGIMAFYISLPTTLSMSIPFQTIQFTTYERCLYLLNANSQYDPKSHVVAGAVAGIMASSVTVSSVKRTTGTLLMLPCFDIIDTLGRCQDFITDPGIFDGCADTEL